VADIASMRDNLELLGRCRSIPDPIWKLFQLGPVLVFAGHRIDPPDTPRHRRRFPPCSALEEAVARTLGEALDRIAPLAAYCGGASGADLLLAEQAIDRGIEVNIVLPLNVESFYEVSIDYGDSRYSHWRNRFDRVLERSVLHQESDENYAGDDRLFVFGTEYLQGLSILRARTLRIDPIALVLVDQASHHDVGGTRWFAETWREATGQTPREIDLAGIRDEVEWK
jgi:hypothetical protein